jgi:IS1 family transposase
MQEHAETAGCGAALIHSGEGSVTTSTPRVILQRLEAEMDELWSFVGAKANRQWVWIAMDATTRQVIAFYVGSRSGQSAKALWEKIPAVYQERALFYTDHYAVYTGVIPLPDTGPSLSWPVRPITSNGSTARYGNGSRGWCMPRFRSLRSSAITLEPFAISFVTTTSPEVQHYQDSTSGYDPIRCPCHKRESSRLGTLSSLVVC